MHWQKSKNKKNTVWMTLIIMFILSFSCLSGCTQARETMTQMREELQAEIALTEEMENESLPNDNTAVQVPSAEEIAGRIEGDDITIEEIYHPVQTMSTPTDEITVALYYGDSANETLVKCEKKIPKVEGLARATIETLLEGPAPGSALVSVIPQGTQLLDINVKAEEKKCIVDFSGELQRALENEQDAKAALESIARTLCQFDNIETVEFRMEGKKLTTLRP